MLAFVTPFRALILALSIALLAGCQGAQVGGQSGSEGCTPEDDLFRADAVPDGGLEAAPDEDGGFETTSLVGDDNQCPAEEP